MYSIAFRAISSCSSGAGRILLLLAICITTATADERGPYKGRPVHEVLDEFRAQGLPLVYSTNLVPESLRVLDEPNLYSNEMDILDAILDPHGLALREVDGFFLVVRQNPEPGVKPTGSIMVIVKNVDSMPAGVGVVVSSVPRLPIASDTGRGIYEYTGLDPGSYKIRIEATGYTTVVETVELTEYQLAVVSAIMELGPAELEILSVSASRYILFSNSQFFIDQRAIQALPDLGEDPLRSVQRLPGTAASGLSSKTHFRGGELNENAIFLNGLQLLDPFHIRDYHNIFSSIDARAISGVEAYTGGFPATFGDHMSGVLVLDSQKPEKPLHTELGLSVFNTSLFNSGYTKEGKVDWLISARRSNLGMVLKRDWGKPEYFDVFAEIGFNLSSDTRLSFNGLVADDKVIVTTENEPEELEESVSDTQNQHFWVLLENQWTPFLSSNTVLSRSSLNNKRNAQVNDPEKLIARVTDNREADILGLRQDWRYDGLADHILNWGFELRRLDARYFYASSAEYFELFEHYPGLESPTSSEVQAAPKGNSYSLFFSDRWQFTPETSLQLGLRWDRQTYTEPVFDNQVSPRFSLLHAISDSTDFRFTWGRYYQSQPIQQLQVEDGLDRFFNPQRSEHWIAGLQFRYPNDYRLRVEAFYKNYGRLKPRFENLYDPLALIPELAPDRVRLDPASAKTRGVELTLEYRSMKELNWWASYTWSKASDSINGVDERRSWDQRHAFQAGLAWQRDLWEIGVALNVHSGWPITDISLGFDEAEDEYFPIPGPRNAAQLGTFYSLDFRISREFPVRHGRLTGFFEATNATNRRNECCIDFDIDEDEDGKVFLDAVVEQWLPAIPAIGVLWEF